MWGLKNFIEDDEVSLSRRNEMLNHLLARHGESPIMIDAIISKKDAFIGYSVSATPEENSIENENIHIGYDMKNDNFSFLLSFDRSNTKTYFMDLNKQAIQFINTNFNQNIFC